MSESHANSDIEIYRILSGVDDLIESKGIERKSWIAFIGEPGSLKTNLSRIALYKWLQENEFRTAIMILTEESDDRAINQFRKIGMDIKPFITSGRLVIGSLYSENKNNQIDNTPNSVSDFISKKSMDFMRKYGKARMRTLLIIDSLASFWEKAPATSRAIWSKIYYSSKNWCDIAIVTLQLSIGTNKGFGFGAEHGADGIIRFGNYIINGEQRRWILIEKLRGDNHDHKIHETEFNGREFIIGDPVQISGRFANVIEAIEGLKYENGQKLDKERNEILNGILNSIKKEDDDDFKNLSEKDFISKSIHAISSILTEIHSKPNEYNLAPLKIMADKLKNGLDKKET